MVTPERLEQLKKILGVTDHAKDDLLTFELELVEDQILAYINQDVLPEQLERPLVMIAAAHWKSAGYGKEQVATGPVTSVKRGDVRVSARVVSPSQQRPVLMQAPVLSNWAAETVSLAGERL